MREHLQSLLDAYTSDAPTEASHLDAMRRLVRSAGDPFSRHHFDPGHFTASAFVLSPELDEVLLILHGKLGRWLQPGGHVDPSDADILAASRREVHEEVGFADLEPLFDAHPLDLDVHTIPALGQEPPHDHFDVRFAFRAPHRDHQAGDEVRGARWVRLDRVGDLESDASVLRAVARLQARLA